ncbi:UDP-3-O-(3-hydroxymyristoyl)glucosamine N-acyltransferase [Humisphaera borealis]|uniref:UDP-3-O-acylglucosamine N-acyltransferase n=1 Tax=Humisphaera borealis TaxID=2807512 RepID=A0A7M2X056_9BACT|nr:UDP-3-O-(3-hydroxymyristoyl)glucosamine N-acyltransferase [Humisphaera borealis]QOV90130.1 UDP-3-O-(3-hydroxymyristoyl)glucosamine N-acyltransferase [Humisphaera borealis]
MHKLSTIVELLGVPLPSGINGEKVIRGLNTLTRADGDELSFLATDKFVKQLPSTRAAAVLVHRKVRLAGVEVPAGVPLIVVDDADLAMAKVLGLFAPPVPRPAVGIDPLSRVAATATIGADCRIGPFVVIGERVALGERCVVHPGTFIGDDTVIGNDCELYPNVVIRERITLGNRVIVNAGSVIGTDGFGYRWDGRQHAKIPQIGTVVIEDDVEIGSCACIDRAKFDETRIGRGTKLDNLVQVGHNSRTGPHCIMAGQSALAGSVTIGTGVVLGGQSAVRDHVSFGDGAMLAGCSGAMDDVPAKQVVSGLPAIPHRQMLREQAALRDLPDLRTQVRKLQEELEALRKSLATTPVA